MTQDVVLTISGLHDDVGAEPGGESGVIEVVTPAVYYFRDGKHYIFYDETVEGIPGTIKNRITISGEDTLDIMKSGLTNSHMIFQRNKTNLTSYKTPYGQMQMGIHTRSREIKVEKQRIQAAVTYGLDIEHEAQAECRISIDIRPREDADRILG